MRPMATPEFEARPAGVEAVMEQGIRRYAEVAAALDRVVDLKPLADRQIGPGTNVETVMQDIIQLPGFYGDGAVQPTPIAKAPTSWDHIELYDKLEIKQLVNAFKVRGAFAGGEAIMREHPRTRSLVAYTAGNHGLGLAQYVQAYNERLVHEGRVRLGKDGQVLAKDRRKLLQAHIFAPDSISPDKRERLEEYRAHGTVLYVGGDSLKAAGSRAAAFIQHANATKGQPLARLLHPYNQPAVMAGQSTILAEARVQLQAEGVGVQDRPLIVTGGVGGGGLALGMAVCMRRLIEAGSVHPDSCVIGVQMEGCDSLVRAFERLDRGETDLSDLFIEGEVDHFDPSADGTAVRDPDPNNVALAYYLRSLGVFDVERVSKSAVAESMLYAERLGLVEEPAGTLGRAGREQSLRRWAPYWVADHEGTLRADTRAVWLAVSSGGNVSESTRREFNEALTRRRQHVLGAAVIQHGPDMPESRRRARKARTTVRRPLGRHAVSGLHIF